MTTEQIKPERIEELRKILSRVNERERWLSFEEFKDLLSILDDYEKVKAERDKLSEAHCALYLQHGELKAELSRCRPLIEAAMGAGKITFVGTSSPGADRLIRAALKLREEKWNESRKADGY